MPAAWEPGDLSGELRRVAELLDSIGQGHIFEKWPAAGTDDEKKLKLLQQAAELDASYPGGLRGYRDSAVKLLAQAERGENPLSGYEAKVPEGRRLFRSSPEFDSMNEAGIRQMGKTAFVLVAGGLGERLGFPDIKLSLPVETATEQCYLSLYCSALLAWQRASGSERPLPLVLMTSDDTHGRTVEVLKAMDNFGLAQGQVTLVKQGKVPALSDSKASFAVSPADPYLLLTKPHGHGDVHQLLHQHGLTEKWLGEGIEWVVFFQDTHGLMVRKLPGMLGVSAQEGFVMNSMSIPRKPGEAVGAMCRLEDPSGEKPTITMNVEYNQLSPLLQATTGKGDEPQPDGLSQFPGNVNTLVLSLKPYAELLRQSGGKVPEFVNPKYTDASRTAFKSPTRLECMMQDIAKGFPAGSKLGFTCFERHLYSPVKNATPDGAAKQKLGQLASCAAAGEADWYSDGAAILQQAGATVEPPSDAPVYRGVQWTAGARIVLHPSFSPTVTAARAKIGPGVSVSNRSTLVVEGCGVRLINLKLDGALVIKAHDDAEVIVDGLEVNNRGWSLVEVPDDDSVPPAIRIRGYKTSRDDQLELLFPKPGSYKVPPLP
eukprot:TRINITY_DN13271_c0_g1_i1.p1 TRINITY_DN13271_c0_g1~~TRINITY_DN13271_c0_g1_i1.p1  ORF type:complete len:616 (+),score=230.69 TRINITY_DN13271_c0_g1_i1:51-1850(+)